MGPGSRTIGPPAYREVEFASAGVMLRGRLYGEASSRPPGPAIVMAHGLSATISGMVADLYAEAFAAAGLRVLLYDHRSFGTSDGAPRHQIDKWLRSATSCAATSPCRRPGARPGPMRRRAHMLRTRDHEPGVLALDGLEEHRQR